MPYCFSFFLLLLCFTCLSLLSCCEGGEGLLQEEPSRNEPPPTVRRVTVEVPVLVQAPGPEGFRPDFTIVTVHKNIQDISRGFREHNINVSGWTDEAINNHLTLAGEREVYHIVVLSLSELGFLEGEDAIYDTVLERADAVGLSPMTLEIALALREQFLSQPDYSTGHRLGEFLAAIDPPVIGVENNIPKVPVIVRDDEYPDPVTGIGLWILMLELFVEGNKRLFQPHDPFSFGGRFAFLVPDHLNLDLLEAREGDVADEGQGIANEQDNNE